jgi:hypothetical protein
MGWRGGRLVRKQTRVSKVAQRRWWFRVVVYVNQLQSPVSLVGRSSWHPDTWYGASESEREGGLAACDDVKVHSGTRSNAQPRVCSLTACAREMSAVLSMRSVSARDRLGLKRGVPGLKDGELFSQPAGFELRTFLFLEEKVVLFYFFFFFWGLVLKLIKNE